MNDRTILTDAAIEAMLARRAGLGAPADLAASISVALDAQPPERRAWWAGLAPSADWGPALRMAWVVAAAALLLAMTFSAALVGGELMRRANELSFLPAPAAAPTPFHGIPDAFETVSGKAECFVNGYGGIDPATGGAGWIVSCWLEMDDPRVSGHEVANRIRITERDGTGYVWVAEEATITNDEGTWRGIIQTADNGSQRNGEGHFIGEGAYEGLEYHYFFGVNVADEHIRAGWVYPSSE
jgi:hypothetical protein